MWIIHIPATFVPLVYYNSYKGVCDKLNTLAKVFMNHGLATGNEDKVYKGVRVQILILNVLAILASGFYALGFGIFMFADLLTNVSQAIAFVSLFLSYFVF